MRNGWFCWLNLICLVAVAHAHLLKDPSPDIIRRAVCLVVPIFAMMAGYSWGGMLKKTKGQGALYALKLFLVPYLFWSTLYFVLNRIILDVMFRGGKMEVSFADVVCALVTGSSATQIWYLISLVYIAALATVLYRFVNRKWIYYCAVALLGLGLLAISGSTATEQSVGLARFLGRWFCWMAPNFLFGLLFSIPPSGNWNRLWLKRFVLPILWIVGFLSIWMIQRRGGETMLAVAIFTTVLVYPLRHVPKRVSATVPCIMGIYLSHVLFTSGINLMFDASAHPFSNLASWSLSFLIVGLSFATVWCMRKIPLLRECV